MYEPKIKIGRHSPPGRVPLVDLLAIVDGASVYIHAINRAFVTDYRATLDVSAFSIGREAIQYCFTGSLAQSSDDPNPQVGCIEEKSLNLDSGRFQATLPKRTVSVIKIPLVPDQENRDREFCP